ncbi:reverse transcriptase domain-containing protein [Tanacetum coccineum]
MWRVATLIMEYFVKISKKARILELKRRNLKNTVLKSNTPYPSRKIRRICACTSQEKTKNKDLYVVSRRLLYACMTRSSTKELFTPFKNPEREFRSSRELFKTLSLDESSSPEFDLFSDLEEHSKEKVVETMVETMEEYMCKTRDNTFSGSDHEDANKHIEFFFDIIDLFHIPNITQDRIMLQAFPMSLTGAASRWLRNKPSGSIETWEDLKTKFLNKYCPPARTEKKMEEINNFHHLYYDCYEDENGLYKLNNLDAYSIRTTLRNDTLPRKEKDPTSFPLPCYINNIYFEKALADLGVSVSVMPLSTYLNLGLSELAHTKLTVELADRTVKHPKGIAENVLVGIGEVDNKPMIDIVKTRYDFVGGLDDYPSNYDFDEKIHIDCAYNLKFSCTIDFEYVHVNFLPILPINVMSKKFYNSIMKDKIEFKWRNELGNFINAPVFIRNFYVITEFIVVEDMDPYLDEGM